MKASAFIKPDDSESFNAKERNRILQKSVKYWNDALVPLYRPQPQDAIPISYCSGVMDSSVAMRHGIPIGPAYWKPEVVIKGKRYVQGIMY